jgi:GNAT superfamily N-acetyltransferase
MTVQITPVRGPRQLREFVALPYRLHPGTPWVPPLKVERYAFLTRKLNPYFTHGEAEYFLARREGRVVGRITAQVNHAFNAQHHSRWGNFGFLELEDDPEVLNALLDAAARWLRRRGMERLVGPMDFTMNDEGGILIEGFDRPPIIRQPWHPPYYQRLLEAAGMNKAMDLLMWELHFTDRYTGMVSVLPEIADRARTEHRVRIRKMSRRRLRRDLDEFARVYNAAWSKNWDFVPFSKEDLDGEALTFQIVFDRDWFMVAEIDGQTAAIAISIPDINQVLRRMNGRVLPFGWWYYLGRGRIIDRVRVGFLGVMPEYQHTGVAAALYIEHFDIAERTRRKGGEMGWILETNESMNRAMEAMGGRIVKRFRVYERRLSEARET